MKIAFYHNSIVYEGDSVEKIALGGTESALIYMARSLAKLGYQIDVYNDCSEPGIYHGVNYYNRKDFERLVKLADYDIFMSFRHLLPMLGDRFARVHIYFSSDYYDQPLVNMSFIIKVQLGDTKEVEVGMYSLSELTQCMDAVFCVGRLQAQEFVRHFNLDPAKVFIVHNGIDRASYAYNPPLAVREPILVYNSTPFRGLEYLLKMFPLIKAKVPKAKLVVMSGMQIYGVDQAEDYQQFAHIYELAKQDGVELLGPLPKAQMADILKRARVLAYPNTFVETFCIAALEAQGAGLPVVTSELGAMPERVDNNVDGYLVSGHPSMESYQASFVDYCVKLLCDDDTWQAMSDKAYTKAMSFDYDLLAPQWGQVFSQLLAKSSVSNQNFEVGDFASTVLIDGYPKTINIVGPLVKRHLKSALVQMELPNSAASIL